MFHRMPKGLSALTAAAALALVTPAFLSGCGARDDYQGATNTDPQVGSDDACAQLTACCSSLDEAQQSMCLGGANGSNAAQCASSLEQFRNAGACR